MPRNKPSTPAEQRPASRNLRVLKQLFAFLRPYRGAVAGAALALLVAACGSDDAEETTTTTAATTTTEADEPTVLQLAVEAGQFSTLIAAIEAAGLGDALSGEGPLTVFAPTDQAFVDLVEAVTPLLDPDILEQEGPFAAIDDLLGPGTIEAVVSYHVTKGRHAANSVVPRQGERTIRTLLKGATFSVSSEGMITAVGNTASIETPNISASNGIIHVIDSVILPE